MKFAVLASVVLFSSFTFAEEAPKPLSAIRLDACAEQIAQHCPGEKTPGEIAQCLFKHMNELSQTCKQDLERVARAKEQAAEQGGGALSTLGGLNSLTPPFPVLTYEGRFSPGHPTQTENKFKLSAPAMQTQQDYLAFTLAGAGIDFNSAVTLDSGLQMPSDVNRAELGVQYTHQLPGYRNWGLRGSIGYAGDHIFENLKNTVFSLNFQYGLPSSTGGFWMWTVFMSNNSPFGNYVPIPGFLYITKSATFTGMFGFPILSMQWTPGNNWAYSLSALGPAVTTEAAYGELQSAQYFANANWNNQSFILSNRVNDKDRMTIEEKKAALGVRAFAFGRMINELQGGYAFDRLIYVGDGLRNMKQGSKSLDSDWFISWSLKTAF